MFQKVLEIDAVPSARFIPTWRRALARSPTSDCERSAMPSLSIGGLAMQVEYAKAARSPRPRSRIAASWWTRRSRCRVDAPPVPRRSSARPQRRTLHAGHPAPDRQALPALAEARESQPVPGGPPPRRAPMPANNVVILSSCRTAIGTFERSLRRARPPVRRWSCARRSDARRGPARSGGRGDPRLVPAAAQDEPARQAVEAGLPE